MADRREVVPRTREIRPAEYTYSVTSYEQRRCEAAKKILPFFKKLQARLHVSAVDFNRDKFMLYLDAIRVNLMAEIEAEPSLTHEDRVQLSQFVSGINKAWPQIIRFFNDRRGSGRMLSLAVVLALSMGELMDSFSVVLVE